MNEAVTFRKDSNAGVPAINNVEYIVIIAIAFIYSCEVIRLLFDVNFGAIAPINRELSLIIYVITAIMLFRHPSQAFRVIQRSPEVIIIATLPLISVFWSASPDETLVRGTSLLGSSLFGLLLAVRLKADQLLKVWAVSAVGVAIVSLALIGSGLGLSADPAWPNAWRGAYLHKNSLGAGSAVGSAILTLYLLKNQHARWRWAGVGLLLNLFLLVSSQSVSAQLSYIVAMLALFTLYSAANIARALFIPLVLGSLPIIVCLATVIDSQAIADFLEYLGRDATLSGRMPLWTSVWAFIQERLWLGYGYEAFWIQGNVDVDLIERLARFRPAYSHNGVLELLLSLGLLGLAIFVAMLAVFCVRLVKNIAARPNDILNSIALVWSLLFIIRNVSEAAMIARDQMIWCGFIAIYLLLAARTMDGLGSSWLRQVNPGS